MNPSEEVLILILADLGTDHRCYKIAASLKKLGYRPVIICDQPLHPLGAAWAGFDVRILTPRSHYLGFLKAVFAYLLRITPILFTTRSRTWIVEDGTPLFWAALIGKLRGKRVIYDAREILMGTPAIRNRPLRRLLWSWWLGAGEFLCGAVWTVSPAFRRHYHSRLGNKEIFLLPNVPNLREADQNAKPPISAKVRLIYTGALRMGSGLPETLAAMALAPEYDLDIYGFGSEEQPLRDQARSLGITDRVVFHGTVPFESLRQPIAEAHIGIHLLEPTCLSFDLTLSNKIFDYVHALTPVLFGKTAAHEELLREEQIGVRVRSLEPADILAGLKEIRLNYSLFTESCRTARTRWAWEIFEPGMARNLVPYSERSG